MLNNLLLALPYLFDKDNPLNIPESWNKWLWYIIIGVAALFLLMIIVLFFKAVRRSRERREEREREKEAAAAKKAEDKAAKEEAKRKKKEKPVKRVLTGITLDLGVVQRDFVIGDDFNCDGLLVNANYNVEPLTETIADFKIVKERVFEKAENGKLEGVHVCKPDMKKEGKKTIRVCFGQQMAMYSISVVKSVEEKPAEEPKEEPKPEVVAVAAPVEEEKAPERVLTGIILDVGIVERDFHVDDEFNCDGLLVTATYSVAPLQETLANFTLVDPALFDRAVTGEISGLYVCKPDLSKAGKLPVRVCYNQQVALYTISVKEKPVEEPKKEEEPKEETIVVAAEPKKEEPAGPREMISLTVNTDYARRDFYVGDTLTHDGLIVSAHYNREPFKEQVSGYTVVAPDMSKVGTATVVIMYQDRATSYTVTVRENPYKRVEPQPAVAQPQQPATPLKERVMTRVSLNSDFVKKEYTVGEPFSREGLMVMAHFNVEPLQEQVTNFTVIPPDMNREGLATVMVAYQDRMLSYQINVRPSAAKPEPQVAPVVEQPKAVRELLSVTLDTGVVQREFAVGDEFNCDGLIVNANFSLAPTLEAHADYNIVDAKSFDQLMNQANGIFVCEPDMSTAGRRVVRVCFNKQIAIYTISVRKPDPQALPVPVVTEEPKPVVREMLSVVLDLGVVQREFEVSEPFNCDGLLVNVNYNTPPMLETYADYNLVEAPTFEQALQIGVKGVFVQAVDTSTAGKKVVRVCFNKHTSLYTISVSEKKQPEPQPEPQPQPQVVFVEKEVEPQPAPVANPQPKSEAPIVIEEESYEATLRYDKSFSARLIQSENEVKEWYTQLKNKLLSFKTCKGRVSWKRETFKAAKQVVAILAFRGNTLCLFLPLDAGDYTDTKYELEDVSNIPAYSETPAMFRLKNNKRIRLALELIEFVMDERKIPVDLKYVSEDFYMPYEGIVELIEKGLVKREIKTAADEAVFTGGESDDGDEDTAVLTEVSQGVYVTKKAKK